MTQVLGQEEIYSLKSNKNKGQHKALNPRTAQ